jgi:hypothetical protein
MKVTVCSPGGRTGRRRQLGIFDFLQEGGEIGVLDRGADFADHRRRRR